MKKLISLILVFLLLIGTVPATSAAGSEQEKAAETLYELGLFRGTGTHPDGTPIFDLDKTPTRNQAVIMLVRLLGKEDEALAGNWNLPFTDVAKGSTAYPYIGYAYANGLTNGTSATTYSGTNPIKANQYITFVLRALGYTSGKDFSVGTAWEFSDAIGLTDGRYSAETKAFTRGDVAVISCSALSVNEKGTVVPLQQKLEEEQQGGYRAWFYVDEMGGLSIQTNIDSSTWDGYSVVILHQYTDGDWGFSRQGRHADTVYYDSTSSFSHHQHGAILKRSQLFVLKGTGSGSTFWSLYEKYNDHEKALAELGDAVFTRMELNTRLRVQEEPADFRLVNFNITYDGAEKETYTAAITGDIRPEGEYGLFYRGKTGHQYAGMSYISRGDGVLTYTRDIGHFAPSGASGTFQISHCVHTLNDSEIICTKSVSNGIEYNFT